MSAVKLESARSVSVTTPGAGLVASLAPIPECLWRRELGEGRVVRVATPDEYDEVGDVLEHAFTTGCWVTPEYRASLHAVAERARTSNVWVVADAEGILAAVLAPQPRHHHAENFTFTILGVGPRGRGLGLGRVLVGHAVSVAASLGYGVVEIHSGPQMTAAHRMYERYGFVRRVERETVVIDGRQQLLSYTLRVPCPASPPVIRRPPRGVALPPDLSGHTVDLTPLTPPGRVDAVGRFVPDPASLPGPFTLPKGRVRLVVSPASPRSWGALFARRATGLTDRVQVEWSDDLGDSPVLIGRDAGLISDNWAEFGRAFARAANSATYPVTERPAIDEVEQVIQTDLVGQVEQAIFSTTDAARLAAQRLFFARLGVWDLELSGRDFLVGNHLTDADLALLGVLVPLDLNYRAHLGWSPASLLDFPHLWAWARRLHHAGLTGVEELVNLSLVPDADGHFRQWWGAAPPVDGVADLRAAWDEPVEHVSVSA